MGKRNNNKKKATAAAAVVAVMSLQFPVLVQFRPAHPVWGSKDDPLLNNLLLF